VQQPAAQLPWGHITVPLDKLNDQGEREFYAGRAAAYGWSRAVLTHHITTGLHQRSGGAVTNFPTTLGVDSDLVTEILRDPYDLDFLALEPGFNERHLEDALVARLTYFLAELGEGFAFVGRQYQERVQPADRGEPTPDRPQRHPRSLRRPTCRHQPRIGQARQPCSLGRDESEYVALTHLTHRLTHDGEEDLQVEPRRQHRVRARTCRHELQIGIKQRIIRPARRHGSGHGKLPGGGHIAAR
jgi:predicted nuclease of restriction endonuclease-like (RecB) superfamily